MGSVYDEISPSLADWIRRQKMFFVATAASGDEGTVNVSPKGYDTLRVLDGSTLAYLDLTGSGVETIAHLRENGRITLMWCAYEGPARIVRIHGSGEVLSTDDERIADRFEFERGARAVILVHADRVSDSCGYAVPLMEYSGERPRLHEWAASKTDDELIEYRRQKNAASIDGLPALD
ncbi:MAG: pyridoxamine 5'-phosphate oxidase family protein [Actinomycetes bacterium]